jgi:hypothetical protein
MKKNQRKNESLIPFLVVVLDMSNNSCTYGVEWAETEEDAKTLAWHKMLDANGVPRRDRDEEYAMDGGRQGYVPILALEKEWVDKMFATAKQK